METYYPFIDHAVPDVSGLSAFDCFPRPPPLKINGVLLHGDMTAAQLYLASYDEMKAANEAIDGLDERVKALEEEEQVQSDWTEIDETSAAYILNKPTLADVATSGSYNDLTDKPEIPEVPEEVQEYASLSAFPAEGEEGTLYVAKDTGRLYRWNAEATAALPEGVTVAKATEVGTVEVAYEIRKGASLWVLSVAGDQTDQWVWASDGTNCRSGADYDDQYVFWDTNMDEECSPPDLIITSGQYVQVGGADVTVDSALSDTSENPVQNKSVKAALDEKRDYADRSYDTQVEGAWDYYPSGASEPAAKLLPTGTDGVWSDTGDADDYAVANLARRAVGSSYLYALNLADGTDGGTAVVSKDATTVELNTGAKLVASTYTKYDSLALASEIPDAVEVVSPDGSATTGQSADAAATYAALASKADASALRYAIVEAEVAVGETTAALPSGVTVQYNGETVGDIHFVPSNGYYLWSGDTKLGCWWPESGLASEGEFSENTTFWEVGVEIEPPDLTITTPATATLQDRASNTVTLADGITTASLTFPAKVEGRARDFFVRLVVTGETVPEVKFYEPDGTAVAFDVDDDSWADIGQGVNLLMFTDTSEETA